MQVDTHEISWYHYCKSLWVPLLPACAAQSDDVCLKRPMTEAQSDMGSLLSKHFSLDVAFSLLHGNKVKNLNRRHDFLQSLLEAQCWELSAITVSGTLIHKNVDLLLFPAGPRLAFSFQHVR